MEVIGSVCDRYGATVVEDNAHGLFGRWKSKNLGTFGALATLSFHETKNVSCGEGGALILNDPSFVDRAEILREKGTDRSRFFRGMVDKYTWVDIGSSWVLSELQAAYLFGQLESAEAIQIARHRTWSAYQRDLGAWAHLNGIRLPIVPVEAEHPAHLFTLILPHAAARGAFIEHMRARDVMTVFHYVPLHLSPMGRRYGGREGQCPVAEDLADRLVRLPLFYGLTGDEYARVVEAALAFTP
jgi:dTDP-4-amino-4,6-dideoxygalactose transaminase